MKLTPTLRLRLKEPLGEVSDSTEGIEKDALIVCVGDLASQRLISDGFKPKLIVYDGKSCRKEIGISDSIAAYDAQEHRVDNPPGTLRPEIFDLFRSMIHGDGTHKVDVNGEEDLTALAVIKEAPDGAIVVYGQPNEGLVIVKVEKEIKKQIERMIGEMEDGD